MKRNNKALYEKIMYNVSCEVKRILNEQDYYANNRNYTVTSTDDYEYDFPDDLSNDILDNDSLDQSRQYLDVLKPSTGVSSKDIARVTATRHHARLGELRAVQLIKDPKRLLSRWKASIVTRNFNLREHIEKEILNRKLLSKEEIVRFGNIWEKIAQTDYPEYQN